MCCKHYGSTQTTITEGGYVGRGVKRRSRNSKLKITEKTPCMKEDFLNVMGHKLPVIAYLRLRET